jgi:hypothetical protein
MNAALRQRVRQRAHQCCEYCGARQEDEAWSLFHIEHVLPLKHGGADSLENLALACQHCNLNKGPNLSGIDPVSGCMVRLFDPRKDAWAAHFTQVGPEIIGLTEVGRTSVVVLKMNARPRLELRSAAAD